MDWAEHWGGRWQKGTMKEERLKEAPLTLYAADSLQSPFWSGRRG